MWASLTQAVLATGPMLEDKYGSRALVFMAAVTVVITGLLSVTVLNVGLLGASGIVFCFIMLSADAGARQGTIPVTTIAVACLFIGREVYQGLWEDQVSQFAHIMGGVCGALFGYFDGPQFLMNRSHTATAGVWRRK